MLGPIISVCSAAQEAELVGHMLSMEAQFFGLSTQDVRYIAFHAAERNNVDHKFNNTVSSDYKSGLISRSSPIKYMLEFEFAQHLILYYVLTGWTCGLR